MGRFGTGTSSSISSSPLWDVPMLHVSLHVMCDIITYFTHLCAMRTDGQSRFVRSPIDDLNTLPALSNPSHSPHVSTPYQPRVMTCHPSSPHLTRPATSHTPNMVLTANSQTVTRPSTPCVSCVDVLQYPE